MLSNVLVANIFIHIHKLDDQKRVPKKTVRMVSEEMRTHQECKAYRHRMAFWTASTQWQQISEPGPYCCNITA